MHSLIGLTVDDGVALDFKRTVYLIVSTGRIGLIIHLIMIILDAVGPLDTLAHEGDVLVLLCHCLGYAQQGQNRNK